jgi:hypothetical protein
MIDILALVTGFILISQVIIILSYMCIRKKMNKFLYKTWINNRNFIDNRYDKREKNKFNSEDDYV